MADELREAGFEACLLEVDLLDVALDCFANPGWHTIASNAAMMRTNPLTLIVLFTDFIMCLLSICPSWASIGLKETIFVREKRFAEMCC